LADKVFEKYGLLTIYGNGWCRACENVKTFCDNNKIKYAFIERDKNNDEIVKNLKNIPEKDKVDGIYKYVPVIVCKNGTFLGGSEKFDNTLKEL
jgi:glutaredoxin